jgi:hypothetical protein
MKTIDSNILVRRSAIMLLIVYPVLALPVFGDYDLSWNTINGGGGTSTSIGGKYEVTGTIGQPDAAYSTGGKFELSGGFWPGGAPPVIRVLDPNGGEILHAEEMYSVTWESFGDAPIYKVQIEYSDNNGVDWNLVDPEEPNIINDGQYDWFVPEVNETKTGCLIRISDVNDDNVFDISDKTFKIVYCWWIYPACWDCDTQCHADADCDCDVDIEDWSPFSDGFGYSYPDPRYVLYACADYNRDGTIDMVDWPQFRDNFGKTCQTGLAQDCPLCDINEIFKP